ncbi:alpha-keto acid decarboxylase family protein [Actinoplanes teichomyceticus]|uniref:Alpha-keto-acid decarboxylase n=1 Tax=Actinoplanes teichomyceticus TaxID=1867 RepID=A0A561VL05_ACTTI|nr:thiamine pyrophosphate-binding protein [Actinoplanes teichomyceticus]TWG12267.1 indolepyruvate decarboxylase [Actinoplanes teichomyceticus]GIF14205.1 alpha-keto-acid decarboxylase [Actinoplanes teichomyceticus]
MSSTITLAEYLGRRLTQAGVAHLFGVPGDFNLTLLDHLATVPGLRWVGSPNELGAGYAADAYARARGLSAIVTTYGVGELSCINAIAGSAAEDVPVVHVVGGPATVAVVGRRRLHHTLADGVFDRFEMAYAQVTVHQETVVAERATEQVDAVLLAAMTYRKPAYLSIPQDLATLPVDPAPLARPLTVAAPTAAELQARLSGLFAVAERPVLVVGHLVARHGLAEPVRRAARQANIPLVTSLAAKGCIDESEPLFRGTYAGTMVDRGASDLVADADLVVELGTVATDVLSGFFTHRTPDEQVVHVGAAELAGAVRVLERLCAGRRFADRPAAPRPAYYAPADPDAPLTQDGLWATVQEWLPPGMAVLADTGTSFWGAAALRLPDDTVLLGQPIWNSIGYALPAVLGQGLADPGRRPILFIGDGAAQMTVQELSTITAHGLTPIIVLLNNRGYTIERALQSPDAGYNDVAAWDWSYLAAALTGDKVEYRLARTAAELRHALDVAGSTTDSPVLIEAELGARDTPPLLRALAERNDSLQR